MRPSSMVGAAAVSSTPPEAASPLRRARNKTVSPTTEPNASKALDVRDTVNGTSADSASTGATINANTDMKTNNSPPSGPRQRINSRDIPRSYAGLYGNTDNLVPFELARKEHTDWIEQGGWLLLATYIGGIALFQVLSVLALEVVFGAAADNASAAADIVDFLRKVTSGTNTNETAPLSSFALGWTIVHILHCAVTLWYLHWCKGSPLYDVQNELAGLTLWEQLEGRPHTSVAKRTLTVVPTLLCYAACHFGHYRRTVCLINVCILWTVEVIAKLPAMNGVRILGINRTPGIDDTDSVHGSKRKPAKRSDFRTKQL